MHFIYMGQLITISGGKIWVESEGEGKGARFSFTLRTVEDNTMDKSKQTKRA